MLAIPFMWDQHYNAMIVQSKEIGITLDYKTLSEDSFYSSIVEIINNPM